MKTADLCDAHIPTPVDVVSDSRVQVVQPGLLRCAAAAWGGVRPADSAASWGARAPAARRCSARLTALRACPPSPAASPAWQRLWRARRVQRAGGHGAVPRVQRARPPGARVAGRRPRAGGGRRRQPAVRGWAVDGRLPARLRASGGEQVQQRRRHPSGLPHRSPQSLIARWPAASPLHNAAAPCWATAWPYFARTQACLIPFFRTLPHTAAAPCWATTWPPWQRRTGGRGCWCTARCATRRSSNTSRCVCGRCYGLRRGSRVRRCAAARLRASFGLLAAATAARAASASPAVLNHHQPTWDQL